MALADDRAGRLGQGVERNCVQGAEARFETGPSAARSETRPGTATGPSARCRIGVMGKLLERGGQRFRVCGVTYGPFAPNHYAESFPSPNRVADDFAHMRAIGINSVRIYHPPPEWLLHLADEQEMAVYLDVPWAKHLCFLDDAAARRAARLAVRQTAERGRLHPCVLAYGIGNEIPPNIVRWLGARRVEHFLAELGDVAKQADPSGLVTYANYPPTEYLELPFLDYATFNVYLHRRETFRRYLLRLQNLVGDKPLLLGELGMDSLRHGELEQADFLAGHLREATLLGVAGALVFSWTDDWFTGGYPIENWAFGITRRDRTPKVSYHALREVFEAPPVAFLPEAPRVSVIVCTFNGGSTLEQCLRSLLALNYPDYEVIVVDDGSTDHTASILARFPNVRAIQQANQGLSAARNVGLRAATGSIIAYTDSDCFADSEWLTQLIYQLNRSGAAAVGGPNLTPEDGWLAACVAASPGQPSHVLVSDQIAEHVPGCNMAFRREALEAINGFDPRYRKAGDDVDICWRLQQAGHWITFAPGAFVWHHRRQTPRAYLRQQAGYGEAEALLQLKHPHKFNGRGDGKWRGVMYGARHQGLRLGKAIIYRGTFGTGLFQCLYQPGPAHWAMLPSTLEWHLAAALMGLTGFFWPSAWALAGAMLVLSLTVAALQGVQARLAPEHGGVLSRLLIAGLCYAQPLVRSWRRYCTRLFECPPPRLSLSSSKTFGQRLPLTGSLELAYWSEDGCERTELLGLYIAYLLEHRLGTTIDSGWTDWDLELHCHPWTLARIYTAQEDHGGRKRLIRVRHQLHLSPFAKTLSALAVGAGLIATGFHPGYGGAVAVLLTATLLGVWLRGATLAGCAAGALAELTRGLGLFPCDLEGRKCRDA
jgi:GT2 family glycosyltransferase